MSRRSPVRGELLKEGYDRPSGSGVSARSRDVAPDPSGGQDTQRKGFPLERALQLRVCRVMRIGAPGEPRRWLGQDGARRKDPRKLPRAIIEPDDHFGRREHLLALPQQILIAVAIEVAHRQRSQDGRHGVDREDEHGTGVTERDFHIGVSPAGREGQGIDDSVVIKVDLSWHAL